MVRPGVTQLSNLSREAVAFPAGGRNEDAGLREALLSLASISRDGFTLLVGLLLAGIEALLHI